jgi:aminoglycoside 2''-phosphotransferase
MINTDEYWHEQIHSVMPDLEIDSYELHQEGLVNDVLIVNNEWVIRFTKTEWGKELMAMENCLMRFVQPKVTLAVPYPKKYSEGIMVYPLLSGEPFLREFWAKAAPADKQKLADQLGQFLRELHGASSGGLDWEIPLTLAPVTRETWLDIHYRTIEKVNPLLLPHQIEWMETLFETALGTPGFFDFEPVLIHGDLAPYHILYSPEEKVLKAVIDFGVAGLGDPATDLGSLISIYGESLVSNIQPQYPQYEELLPRARFYAQAIEVQWVLLGVESGENYWFTAHLGGARDIGEQVGVINA